MSKFFAGASLSYLHEVVQKVDKCRAHLFKNLNNYSYSISNFTIAYLVIPFAAFFLNSRVVYYFKFLTAIFNTKFVQRMWLCSQTACCA